MAATKTAKPGKAPRKLVVKNEIIAGIGEFLGTTLFLFLGELGIKTAVVAQTASQLQTGTGTSSGVSASLSNPTILYISVSMGLALLSTAWVFYRITGGLFNPAITFALWLCGAVTSLRAIILVFAQYLGGISASALVAVMTPGGGVSQAITKLQSGMNTAQGFWIEALLTSALVFTVLMLAAEKHKATFMAPIGIGLVLFVCQLAGTLWTGCGMNPARAIGPSVVSHDFPGYHWIYQIGPFVGALISVALYITLKALDYGSVVLGQDADSEGVSQVTPIHKRVMRHAPHLGFSHGQRHAMTLSGMSHTQIADLENQMVSASNHASNVHVDRAATPVNDFPRANGEAEKSVGTQAGGAIGRPSMDGDSTGTFGPSSTSDETVHRPTMGERRYTPMDGRGQQHGFISSPGTHAGLLRTVLHPRQSHRDHHASAV